MVDSRIQLLPLALIACSEYALNQGKAHETPVSADTGPAWETDEGSAGDGPCVDGDGDRDDDGLLDAEDPFPDDIVVADLHVDFDDFAVGTAVADQFEDLGLHLEGGGAPGEGYDSNVVETGPTCTSAILLTSPNVLCTWVDAGFNFAGDPGLAGWVDDPVDAVTVRLYNAGMAFAATVENERDQATLLAYDAGGNLLGEQTAVADTSAGEEYVDLLVMGAEATSFALYSGDFDAIDDLHLYQLEPSPCD